MFGTQPDGLAVDVDMIDVRGTGGEVVVWSENRTQFFGALSARGGAWGGDGGRAEISGRQALSFDGQVNLSAPSGSQGSLLFDPDAIIISNTSAVDLTGNVLFDLPGTIATTRFRASGTNSLTTLLQNQAACISTMIYNEYWQVVDAGVKESDLVTFFYEKEGVATLEDGLYVMEVKLKDPAFVARMAKFLKATFKGWNDAVKDPEGAAKVVVAADASGSATLKVQKRQMENVAKLITNAGTPKIGYLEPAAYERTVKVLLAGGSSPVIKKDPGKAAMSHVVWEAAAK